MLCGAILKDIVFWGVEEEAKDDGTKIKTKSKSKLVAVCEYIKEDIIMVTVQNYKLNKNKAKQLQSTQHKMTL